MGRNVQVEVEFFFVDAKDRLKRGDRNVQVQNVSTEGAGGNLPA